MGVWVNRGRSNGAVAAACALGVRVIAGMPGCIIICRNPKSAERPLLSFLNLEIKKLRGRQNRLALLPDRRERCAERFQFGLEYEIRCIQRLVPPLVRFRHKPSLCNARRCGKPWHVGDFPLGRGRYAFYVDRIDAFGHAQAMDFGGHALSRELSQAAGKLVPSTLVLESDLHGVTLRRIADYAEVTDAPAVPRHQSFLQLL
jgi:hypothetical protein